MTKPEKRKVSSVDVELALPKRENIFIPQIDSMPDCNTDQHKFSQDFIDRNSEPLSEIPDADADSQNEKNTKRAKELWSKAQAATGTPVDV